MYILLQLVFIVHVFRLAHPLPSDCSALESQVLDEFDPLQVYSANHEIAQHQPPRRVPDVLRAKKPIPTHHFVTSQLKAHPEPMVLWPYFSTMDSSGIVYDAFEFKRFYDPERTVYADGQSMPEEGRPWHRILELGTNMFQKVSGPDGNPLGNFDGKSGVKVGIASSSEPQLQAFGDLYADFLYTGNGGTMEVPLVRGSILLTHIFTNANPVVTPYCLDNINGESHTFDCPLAPASNDGGSGYLSATCAGSSLEITLHNTRTIKDLSLVQWAANTALAYPGSHGMSNCNPSQCRLADEGKTVHITVPNASGQMSFAINYIGHYVLPPDWTNKPQQVTCSNNIEIRVDVAGNNVTGIEPIQYAIEPESGWGNPPAMRPCDPTHCTKQGNVITIRYHATSDHLKFAINIIYWTTLPFHNWIEKPLSITCGANQVVNYGGTGTPSGSGTTVTQPSATTQTPVVQTTIHTSGTSGTSGQLLTSGKKFVLEMNEQGKDLPNKTRKYALYFSSEVTPRVNQGTISFSPRSGGTYNGIMQLAYLGSGARGHHDNDIVFDAFVGVYPYKPVTSYCVSETTQKVHAQFRWQPNNQHAATPTSTLLMLMMPHHALLLKSARGTDVRQTVFGFEALEGDVWDLTMDLPRATMEPDPTAVASLTTNQRQEIENALISDTVNQNLDAICAHTDSYNVGKAIGMTARLASVSRALGTPHFRSLDTSIQNCLEKWLRIQDTLDDMWKFQYDAVWGGLFLRATSGNLEFGVDYGFPYYNDHHFHLGYFIYAAAYFVKYHPQWTQTNKHRVYLLARDVSNLSQLDRYFPVARHKDIYTGFSWASGLVPGVRQEESASEGINCYHGVAALGEALNDKRLQHTGQVLLAMEILSVREYWQVRAHNRNHFPPIIQETGVVGMIGEDSFYAYTLNWPCDPNVFPMRHACLVGIQVIPITAVSKYWMDQEWAASIQRSCTAAIFPEGEPQYAIADTQEKSRHLDSGWAAFCFTAMAPLDGAHQTQAANYVKNKRPQELVGGTSAASTLLFIYAST
ncbi:hypothetical protein DPMN_012848 [Dreissena polymorpha]|uniref:glucan endo-1,3-beta-D-glucosidase n=1 Tax=Dreissena polymorpha TaxID=45954 RepID=A0A9D4S346_DREPO|nr:hypothetical protein DPMN_012848 [Dreissena polymorpha]